MRRIEWPTAVSDFAVKDNCNILDETIFQWICDEYLKSDVSKMICEEAQCTNAIAGEAIAESLLEGSQKNVNTRRIDEYYKSSWLTQLRYLSWRSFTMTVRDPVVLKVRLLQTIIAALLAGVIYGGTEMSQSTIMNYNGALFSLVCNMNWLFQNSAVELFCFEMPIFLREYQSGLYRTDAYFLAKNLAEVI